MVAVALEDAYIGTEKFIFEAPIISAGTVRREEIRRLNLLQRQNVEINGFIKLCKRRARKYIFYDDGIP